MTAVQTDLVTLTIDGVSVTVPKGTLLVEAAKQIKQEIPVYCYHTKLGPAGLCRVCLVEIEGMPKLQIACNTAVTDGMVVHTQNEKATTGRAMVIELLLVNHPLDCPICDKGGECELQDYALAYGRGYSDVIDGKLNLPKAVDLGPTIVLDEERCIVCQRCVRFDDIIADEQQLVVRDRGVRDIIATAGDRPYKHNFTGNVTELCPVGALTSKTYRFKSRPWDLRRTKTTCTQCSVGCQIFSDTRFGAAQRTMLVEDDDAISDGWLCDRGRYNIGFYASPDRVTQPLYKQNGTFVQIGWDDAFALWAKAIKDAIASKGAQSVGAIGGGRLTNEEAYLLQHTFRSLGVKNLDWRAGTQRQAAPGKSGAAIADIEAADAIVILGDDPGERAPVFDLRIRKAVLKHRAVVVRAKSADEALKGVGERKRVAIVWDGVEGKLAASVYGALADREPLTYITGEQPNARGAEAMGMLPRDRGASGDELFAQAARGDLNVLSLFGVNPLRNHPDRDLVRDALAKTPFVVASELFLTETAQAATLVLPAKGAFEKTGTTINFAGDLLPVEASLEAPEGVLSDLEMLIGLSREFDFELPTQEDLHAKVVAAAAKMSDVAFGDEAYGAALPGTPRAASIFDGGGTAAHDERIASLVNA
jgi:NADH-quinone oxidoreductase subunit G